ncbi:CoA pyrophosphatase [Shinella kummerowiae]|jgi:8-oxo-dGTP pyrophosphatase MutT (NUDIX family)|uniref:CoA pyrophosphatase n=1 Tax=Shinella kummerowiae TaxID=417745 RepID=A0A6N8S5C7_9HYPH|nr:CoA pyrophosphatase [Shinella kummerowiae]MCT7663408.1 CoA pyrophosphatase [Shinella kummerowiae]MXN44275.1 CoA pyrophosphatase [Shinella kummerowiae]
MSFPPYSAAEFRRRAMAQALTLGDETWREHGDSLLNPSVIPHIEGMALRDAAVLIPVVDDGEEARVIFTQRTATMRKHSGQIAFPGGAVDDEDEDVEAAAMREAEEEISLDRRFVEPVGRLPQYKALSGFSITPVLAVVQPGFELIPNPAEVETVFDVPLSFLMDPRNHERGSGVWLGSERHYYRMPYEGHNIWGITAGIVRVIYERLYA